MPQGFSGCNFFQQHGNWWLCYILALASLHLLVRSAVFRLRTATEHSGQYFEWLERGVKSMPHSAHCFTWYFWTSFILVSPFIGIRSRSHRSRNYSYHYSISSNASQTLAAQRFSGCYKCQHSQNDVSFYWIYRWHQTTILYIYHRKHLINRGVKHCFTEDYTSISFPTALDILFISYYRFPHTRRKTLWRNGLRNFLIYYIIGFGYTSTSHHLVLTSTTIFEREALL